MLDFLKISTRRPKKNIIDIYPKFIMYNPFTGGHIEDLMVRGGDFYAVWDEESGKWSENENDALRLIDKELKKYYDERSDYFVEETVIVSYMWDSDSGSIDRWHKFCQKQKRDHFHNLNEKLVFSNSPVNKMDYSSKRLNYPLTPGKIDAYEKLISTLYIPEERHKIEWAIGSIITGASKNIQKFLVFYGASGTGKSTVLHIIEKLFDGYQCSFDAKSLGSSNSNFALEAFRDNPLVAIQHDGDLSRIEDNTRLNSLVSHEMMTVNVKFKSSYQSSFNCFLFMGTNKPVKITDGKSGIIRRLIDVHPSGNLVTPKEYRDIMNKIDFELGAIACHCRDVYMNDPDIYDDYTPLAMLGATNDIYNFVLDNYHIFSRENGTSLKSAWEMYKSYCNEANVAYPYSKRAFKEELKNYFDYFDDRATDDNSRIKNRYSGFKTDVFETQSKKSKVEKITYKISFPVLDSEKSILDDLYSDAKAQYATVKGTPIKKWDNVETKLCDIDTSRLHYLLIPETENHIFIDFDIKDEHGDKNLEKNIEAASKWPETYAEISQGGNGIHLHYIYDGDVSKLSRIFDDQIEIKTFTGKSSLRRKLTKCHNVPIAHISSGLPLRGTKPVIDENVVYNEKALRTIIKRNLNKEYHDHTKPSIDFIYKILNDAYNGDIAYDVSDMYNDIFAFAASSTNQSDYCIDLVGAMHFKSDKIIEETRTDDESELVFFDIEVLPNLFVVDWKFAGINSPVVKMIMPNQNDIEDLCNFNIIGFNNRRYDNHMLMGRIMGYNERELYNLSKNIINGEKNCFFGNAYNLSYTDVYDFASSQNKKGLKKMEIEMAMISIEELEKRGFTDEEIAIIKAGQHHQELEFPWDKPVPEEKWMEVADYCANDVLATEAAFVYLSADWTARKILADIAGKTVNDTTNTLTECILFGNNKRPQSSFNYRDMSVPVYDIDSDVFDFLTKACPDMMANRHGPEQSILPYFPGYKYTNGVSIYMDEVIGEGGYVYAEPGIHENVALLDVASMHPHSIISECLFGVEYTTKFLEIVQGRISIKHESWDSINDILDGKLVRYIEDVKNGKMTSKDLANALKTAINSVYGLTAANFDNPFRDIRNKDNLVAKRGALFMVDLKYEVQKRGFTVAHIKTDSIKIPNATPEIIDFVMSFGKKYGYTFEHEATYERMCLINDAVYIAKYADADKCEKMYGYVPGDNKKKGGKWTPTGTQFSVPYVFKKLFSKEAIGFYDLCETKSVTTALYLDMNERLPDSSEYEKLISIRNKVNNEEKITRTERSIFEKYECLTDEEVLKKANDGHDRKFVGKVGLFCPIKPGCNGGILNRETNGKYTAVNGSKGYRWLEAEEVKRLGLEDTVDRTYYDNLVDKAVDEICKYGDVEWFCSDDTSDIPYDYDDAYAFNVR